MDRVPETVLRQIEEAAQAELEAIARPATLSTLFLAQAATDEYLRHTKPSTVLALIEELRMHRARE